MMDPERFRAVLAVDPSLGPFLERLKAHGEQREVELYTHPWIVEGGSVEVQRLGTGWVAQVGVDWARESPETAARWAAEALTEPHPVYCSKLRVSP